MLSMKDTGLVQGVPLADTPTVTVRVLRGFIGQDGKPHQAGELVSCSKRFAASLTTNGKAMVVPTVKVEVASVEPVPAKEPEQIEAENATAEPKHLKAAREARERRKAERGE